MLRKINFSLRTLSILVMVASFWGTAFAKPKTAPPTIQPVLDQTHAALFTPDNIKWSAAPKVLSPGIEIAMLEGDHNQAGLYTIRLKIPANTNIPAHWNPSDEHITIISGEYNMGLGDNLDKNKGTLLPAGSFARTPAKMHHYAWTTVETIIQLHGQGPWGIIYLNPADDPSAPPLPAATTTPTSPPSKPKTPMGSAAGSEGRTKRAVSNT